MMERENENEVEEKEEEGRKANVFKGFNLVCLRAKTRRRVS